MPRSVLYAGGKPFAGKDKMPVDKDLKRLIRSRMARTGETYSTARMWLLTRRGGGDAADSEVDGLREDPRMQFDGTIEDGRRYIVLSDLPPEYSFVAEHTFEAVGGGSYRLEYQGDPDSFEQVVANWRRDGAMVMEQSSGGLSGDWSAALEALIRRLDGHGVSWFLLGTAALAVRGIDIRPMGVDIGTDRNGAEAIGKLFVDRALIPVVEVDWHIARYYGRLFCHALIQVMAEPPGSVDDHGPRPWGPEGTSRLETVTWRGHDLLVTPLDLQLADEKARDRKANVTAILRWMHA